MSYDTLDTVWLLYHTDIISHIEQESDLDNLANATKLFTNIIKAEKARRTLRVFTATPSDRQIRPKYFEIHHQLRNTHNINSVSVRRTLFENPEYTILQLVNSDDTAQIVDNMSMIVSHRRDLTGHLYEITLPHELDVVYKLDKVRVHHSPCTVISAIMAYGSAYLRLYGKIISISPTVTDITFSETLYPVPSVCLKFHPCAICVMTDTAISKCDIHINTEKEIGVDDEINNYNTPRTCYQLLNNTMMWHQFRSGMVGMMSICWRPYGGDTLCKTVDAPDPSTRFTPQEMLEWLTTYQIVQFNDSDI
jgi:hypothetical protein